MNDKRYKWILYIIVLVIACTIGIQVYWNYKNYLVSKQQLVNDVQSSLDRAVDDYYANLAQQTTMGFSFEGDSQKNVLEEGGFLDRITKQIDANDSKIIPIDSIDVGDLDGVAIFTGFEADSMMASHKAKTRPLTVDSFKRKFKDLKKENDSLNLRDFQTLTSKVVISISNDTLVLKDIDSLLKIELDRKHIDVDYSLRFKDDDQNIKQLHNIVFIDSLDGIVNPKKVLLNTMSRSTFLPKNSELSIFFTNETQVVLQRILGGIFISTLLVLAVIGCLFYLLKIIRDQKQLAEVKNDLISNITHEFKTPIATIGAALEGINNFNIIEDKNKTKEYINMSSSQLSKLNVMVEKLLETATLDSENLELKKEPIDLVALLNTIVHRFETQHSEKTFSTSFKVEEFLVNVDSFHFENAINNILDNAVKYGGDIITIDITPKHKSVEISISDNGQTLSKSNKDKVFEKFYRVPKGNTHDVKGFGIGLYYTKTIIEKHNGSIQLDLNNILTTFKISLPNA
ncbi:MAG: ATP-binding protein [Bacteroidota bacterium]